MSPDGKLVVFGHDRFHLMETVECIAVSPDGALVAAGSGDGTMVFELESGRVVGSTKEAAYGLAFEDEATLFLAMARIYRWRFAEGEPVEVSKHLGSPLALNRERGLVAAAAREGGDVGIFTTSDWRIAWTVPGRKRPVSSLSFCDDGTRLAIGTDGDAIVVDVASGKEERLDTPANGTRVSVAFMRGSDRVLVSRGASDAVLIAHPGGGARATLKLDGAFSDFALSPDGARVAVASYRSVSLFTADGEEISRVGRPGDRDNEGYRLAFLSNHRIVAGAHRALRFLDLATGRWDTPAATHEDGVSALALAPDGSFVATGGGGDGTVRVWNAESGEHRHAFDTKETVDALAIAPDARRIYAATWRALWQFELPDNAEHSVPLELREAAALACGPDGAVATVSESGSVVLRGPRSSAVEQVLCEGHRKREDDFIRPSVAFSGDGRWLAFQGEEKQIGVFDRANDEIALTRRVKRAFAFRVAFAPDASCLAYLDGDDAVVIELPGGRELARHEVRSPSDLVLLAPTRLAMVRFRGPAEIVDLVSGERRTFQPERAASAIQLASDGRVLVGYQDGTAALVPIAAFQPPSPAPTTARPEGVPPPESAPTGDPYRSTGAAPRQLPADMGAAGSAAEVERATGGLFAIERDGPRLTIRLRWLSRKIVTPLLTAAVFGYLVHMFLPLRQLDGFLIFVWLLFCLAALWGAYTTLAYLVNHTRLEVDGAAIRVRFGPLPWPGGGRWSLHDVTELYVKERSYRRYKKGGGSYTEYEYELRARLTSGRDVLMLTTALQPAQAKALEATLEAHLGLANRPVDGEYAP
jgi:WD40 repeat protein